MLQNTMILKAGGGLLAAGSVGGLGYAFHKQIWEHISGTSQDTYLIVKTTSDTNTPASGLEELYTTSNNLETKNFTCKYKENEEDKTCDIFSLKDDGIKKENKLIDLKKVIETNVKTKKAEISQNKFFKLKLKKGIFDIKTFDGEEKITIFSNIENKTTQKYGEFKVLYKIEGDKVTGKTNWIIGKAKEKQNITDTSSTQCLLEGSTNKADCSVYKFEQQPANGKNFSDLSFESSKLTTPVADNSFVEGQLYLIDLKTQKLDISALNEKTIILYEKKETNPGLIVKFNFVAALASDENSFAASTSKTFFLN